MIEEERKKAELARKRCEALLSQLSAQMGRLTEGTATPNSSPEVTPAAGSKRKSPSTEEDSAEKISDGTADGTPPAEKKRTKTAAPSMMDIVPDHSSISDDGVESPEEDISKPAAKGRADLYKELDSIVTAYKTGDVNPKDPDSPISFLDCAEICENEAKKAERWDKQRRAELHGPIISALRVGSSMIFLF